MKGCLTIISILILLANVNGQVEWAQTLGSTGVDCGKALAVDNAGNVIVGGHFEGTADFGGPKGVFNLTSNGRADIFIAKYDPDQNLIWAYNIGGGGHDSLEAIVYNAITDVFYITGSFEGTVDFDPGAGSSNLTSAGSGDVYVAKYTGLTGAHNQSIRIGDLTKDEGKAVGLDPSGNVYVGMNFQGTVDVDPGAGFALRTSNGQRDIEIAKYDNNLNYIWDMQLGGTGEDNASSVTPVGAGAIAVTGQFSNTVDLDPGGGVDLNTSAGSKTRWI